MADEGRLNDLVNQAVSSEYPHIYGAVNLNRLREVLFFLAASRRSQPEQPEHVIPWNEQTEQDAIVVRKLSEEFEKCDSLQNVLDTASSSAPEAQDDELKSVVNITDIRSPSLEDERPFSELSVNSILIEIEKIGQKVNEINERVFRMEAKSLQLESQFIHNVKVMGDDGAPMTSKSITSLSNDVLPSSKLGAPHSDPTDHSVGTGCNSELNLLNEPRGGSFAFTESALPPKAIALSTVKPASNREVVSSEDLKHNSSGAPQAVVFMELEREGANCQLVAERAQLPTSHNDLARIMDTTMGAFFSTKLEDLTVIVERLMERERVFSEWQNNVEQMVTSYIEESFHRFQKEQCVPPVGPDVNIAQSPKTLIEPQAINARDKSFQERDLEKATDTNPIAETSFETEMRSIVAEMKKDISFLKAKLNHGKIAAGCKLRAEVENVYRECRQCISCDCPAMMNECEEPIPRPTPFHANRCLKPFLRRQLDCLQKELRDSNVVALSMEPYLKLLKKRSS